MMYNETITVTSQQQENVTS